MKLLISSALLLLLTACGGGASSNGNNEELPPIPKNAYFENRLTNVFVYNSSSPYAATLVPCTYSNQLTSSCTLSKLPLIAQDSTTPSVDDIMKRVVVSHQWMGDRFKEFLLTHDTNNDFKNLLRATTAIVIASDIRPSFYWVATGAIYLDPENFWLAPQEHATISTAPDFRANFSSDLQFVMPWRYIKNNQYASNYYPPNSNQTRSLNDIVYDVASLMYHELAHANDFFPSTEWFSYNNNRRILDIGYNSITESDDLVTSFPLLSDEMKALAEVRFDGEPATALQKSYLPSDVEIFYKNDQANDFYNYSSEREDFAMLFEELMMQARYNVLRDTAITNNPSGSNLTGDSYIVTWGQRGRIADTNIKDRALFAAEKILPELDAQTAVDNLAEIQQFRSGESWTANLVLSNTITGPTIATISANLNISEPRPLFELPYYHKPLPKN